MAFLVLVESHYGLRIRIRDPPIFEQPKCRDPTAGLVDLWISTKDVHDEKTQAMMLWALTGEAGSEVAKKVVQVATKTAGTTAGRAALKSMPNQASNAGERGSVPV